MIVNIAVVDDQKEFHHIILSKLENSQKYELKINCFTNVGEMEASEQYYDLVLLDICMPNINGIDYARSHLNKNIVFVSGYQTYMKKSFGSNVYGFIEKSEKPLQFLKQCEDAIDRILNQKKIQLNAIFGQYTIYEKDIIYVQYDGYNKINVVTENDNYILNKMTLKEFYLYLSDIFIFCSRDTIVNIDKILGFNENKLIMIGTKTELRISRRRYREVKRHYFMNL